MSSNNDAVNPHPPGDDTTSGEATQVSPVATSGNIDDAGTNCDQIKSWKGWVELENDPVIFSTLLREWGVPDIQVNEVIPLDTLLDYDPDHIYGLIFLSRWVPANPQHEMTGAPSGVWFANQTDAFSCATVSLMNIINNRPAIDLGPKLNAFREATMNMTPKERGHALDKFDHVRDVHNSFATEFDKMNVDLHLKKEVAEAEKKRKAKAAAAASQRPRKKRKEEEEDDDDESGFHFVAYLPAGGYVWRMDGMERLPRKMGSLGPGEGWTAMVIPELQTQLESAAANALEFSLLSLTAMTESSSLEADQTRMERVREDWGPFIATLVGIHAEKGTLKDELGNLE